MIPGKALGLVAEFNRRRISIFDTDTLEVIQQLEMDADVVDVAVTADCTRAFACAYRDRTMFQIDLCETPARVVGSAVAQMYLYLGDVAVTPDGRFALAVDVSALRGAIISYSARKNEIVSSQPTEAQAVAVSPTRPELVLTADYFANSVRRFRLHSDGALEDTGQSFPAELGPTNITFSPCGNFAFVSSRVENRLLVLSTRDPENIMLLGGAACTPRPQSMAVTRDGRHVFLLTAETVDVYSFDPIAGSLTLTRSFEHGHSIRNLTGTDQIALDACDERVFVVTLTQVAVFTTYGLPLGIIVGAEGPGGIAICSCNWDHRV